jgi:hypothetical protein
MKTKLIISITFLLFTSLSYSQKKNVSIGPIVGLNYSKVSSQSGSEFKTGFNGGVFLNYSTKTDFGFNGSLIYSQLGGNVTNSDNFIRLNYIQLPINLVYYFGEGLKKGSFRPKIFVGPYIGYLIGAESPGFTDEFTLKQLNTTDLGINGGLGFNLALKSQTWLNVDLKYGHGFNEVPKIFTYKNRALSLNVGISFPLGTYDKKTGRMR